MVLVHAEDLQLLSGRIQIGFGVFLRVLRLLQHGLRDGSVLIQILRAQIRLVGELLVVRGLYIGVECAADVGALYAEQQLAFLHVVVEPRADVDHAAVGHGDHGNLARDVGKHRAGHVQLVRLVDSARRHRGILVRMVHGHKSRVAGLHHLRRRGRSAGRVEILLAGRQRETCGQKARASKKGSFRHGITSRPTARFSCAADVRYAPISCA